MSLQHRQLLPGGRVPDLDVALVRADRHQVTLKHSGGQRQGSGVRDPNNVDFFFFLGATPIFPPFVLISVEPMTRSQAANDS